MKLLAIETATEACSAALYCDGDIADRYQVAPRVHTQLILPMCDALLAEAGITLAQIDAVAFGRGPGSFTGLRIAAGVAQGMAFAHDIPVLPISSLAAIAQETMYDKDMQNVLVAMDARMREVYWGYFRCDKEGLMQPCGEEGVSQPDAVPVFSGLWFGAGSGWRAFAEVLKARLGYALLGCAEVLPKAQFIIHLALAMYRRGGAVAAERAVPVYLRDKVATKNL